MEGKDVPSGERKEGKEEEANSKAKGKDKKTSFECSVCQRHFPSGQALGGHMNAHPQARYKKAKEKFMKMNNLWAEDQTPDLQQSNQIQAPPYRFNFVPGPAIDMPNSQQSSLSSHNGYDCIPFTTQIPDAYLNLPPYHGYSDVLYPNPYYNLAPHANYQQETQDQVNSGQSTSMMMHDAQNLRAPSWNTPSSSSLPYLGSNDVPWPDSSIDPAPQAYHQQVAQDQVNWDQSNSMMSHHTQHLATPSSDAPGSSSQPSCGYSDFVAWLQLYQDPDTHNSYQDPNAQNSYQDPNAQNSYQDPNAQNSSEDPNAQNSFEDPNAQNSSEDSNSSEDPNPEK